MTIHTPCGQQIPNGETGGHCAGCCRSFRGLTAFEMHQTLDERGRTICHDPATMRNAKGELRPFWQDKTGCWHHGPRNPDPWWTASAAESRTRDAQTA